ncbi:hypothetical protein FALBO_6384 [Fusarium albosuccineum]|uniref:Uncharacterized protein n=1 Tax=Fusarium albosuccineum TaxID=1237068 RepID=A0A8H4PDE6_9HYPO|nr:hypothetical protein FALBO_6384 [Fusarium albosuccineum]
MKATTTPPSTPPRSVRTLGAMKIDRSSPDAGRVNFPTPMLRKFHEQSTALESLSTKPEPTSASSPSLIADLQSLRRIVPESHFRIYDAIFGWMNNLLRATEPLSQVSHPKSLLGMCLRKVPAALAVIEAWDCQTAEEEGRKSMWESSKASTELYGQLEGFGAAGLGWKPLSLVVRAHALSLLSASVSEGLFETSFVRLLAELCLSLGCNEEATRLASSLNCSLAAPRNSSSTLVENTTVQPFGAIVRSLHGQGPHGASLECITGLMRSKRLPLSWLTSRAFQAVWTRAVEILNSRSPAPSAVDFICTAVNQLVLHESKRKGQERTEEQTLVSVLAALTAAAWTLGADKNDSPGSWRKQGARRMLHVLECCVVQHQKRRGAFRTSGLFAIVLARFIATAMIDSDVVGLTAKQQASQECARLLTARNGVPSQSQYRQTLSMACSVAQYRGRACGLPCHDILPEICTALDGIGLPDWFHAGLGSDGAFVLAQKTRDLRDIAFAEKLAEMMGRGNLETSTMFSGWRWEDGIGEWVLPSPGLTTTGGDSNEHVKKREARNQRGTDRRQDGPRCNRPVPSSSPGDDGDSSVESDEDKDDDDKAADTDEEDENDTSATTIMDMEEEPDSGDELGECALTELHDGIESQFQEQGTGFCARDSRGTTTNRGNRRRTITTVKFIKGIKRAANTRTRSGTGSEKLGRGTSGEKQQVGGDGMAAELDWDDELGMP